MNMVNLQGIASFARNIVDVDGIYNNVADACMTCCWQVWNPPWWWTFQTTIVDMATLGPVIDEAMAVAGISKKAA